MTGRSARRRAGVLVQFGIALGLWVGAAYAVLLMLAAGALMLAVPAAVLFGVGLVLVWAGLVCWRRASARLDVLVEAGLWPDGGGSAGHDAGRESVRVFDDGESEERFTLALHRARQRRRAWRDALPRRRNL